MSPCNRIWAAIWLSALLATAAQAGTYSFHNPAWETLISKGPHTNRVDIVVISEGYTASQMTTDWPADSAWVIDYMLHQGHQPYNRYVNFFNVHRVNLISQENGVDHLASTSPDGMAHYYNTALDAIHGYEGASGINYTLADDIIENQTLGFNAEVRIVPLYEPGGDSGKGYYGYAIYSAGPGMDPDVAMHEVGHAWNKLADEYYAAGTTYTGGEPTNNANATIDPTGPKWAEWLGYQDPLNTKLGTVGVYEGCKNRQYGIYRPCPKDRMYQSWGYEFCGVCREKVIHDIYTAVRPIDSHTDNSQTLLNPATLTVDVVDPGVINVAWSVDGVLTNRTGETLTLANLSLSDGTHQITARAYDNDLDKPYADKWVRRNLGLLEQSVTWTVQINPVPANPVPATVLAQHDMENGASGGSGWAGSWTFVNGGSFNTFVKKSGSYSLCVSGAASATRTVDMTGATDARLRVWYYAHQVEAGDSVYIEVYDGAWHTLQIVTHVTKGTWKYLDAPLGEYAMTSNFQVRFRCFNMTSSDYTYFDDIQIVHWPRGVVQSAPVEIPGAESICLGIQITNSNDGAIYDSGEISSALLGGLGQQILGLPANQSKTLERVLGTFGIAMVGPPTGEVASGWSAVREADGKLFLGHAPFSWSPWYATRQDSSLDTMVLTVSVPTSLLDGDGDGWSAGDPRDWQVVLSEAIVTAGFVGYGDSSVYSAYAFAYDLARPNLAGDINGDSYVDAADLLALGKNWAKVSGEPGYDPRCDLTGDGVVDEADLLALAENWGG